MRNLVIATAISLGRAPTFVPESARYPRRGAGMTMEFNSRV